MNRAASFEQEENNLTRRLEALRIELEKCDLSETAAKAGARFEPGEGNRSILKLRVWERPLSVHTPELVVLDQNLEPASLITQVLVLYYLQTAHGPGPAGDWISFSELPEGKFYNPAFQGYSGKQLARVFGNDLSAVERAGIQSGGQILTDHQPRIGDLAIAFQVLPRLPILLVGWQGDEDFPSSYQFLFDITASNYLPTDVCAIVGGMLARRIIANRRG